MFWYPPKQYHSNKDSDICDLASSLEKGQYSHNDPPVFVNWKLGEACEWGKWDFEEQIYICSV